MLENFRQEIDQLDEKIINALEQRYKIVAKIKHYKKEQQLSIMDLKREQEIINKIKQKKLINEDAILLVYQQILAISRSLQE